ncbi:transmembrane protein 178B isoform X2 [Agrilus planipennis]|uniref:Transmembrane protein 178B isoform X2 n=2 Tax=Agrilus planipennis TaxID=224129 RepID=A0A1W4WFZ9_AGRPL|nr:transmembrane protein 178B isoform X2 [Agrilus planipennis]
MPCSAITLSLATIASIIAVALLAIAFATDNWVYIEVKRSNIQDYLSSNPNVQNEALVDSVNTKYYYYTRTKGLFRICFPKERPPTVKTYLSPVETHCTNINYFIPDENNETKDFTDDAWTRLHMGRSTIALFILSFLTVLAAFFTGVTGCWRRSPSNITATAILMLLACLLSAGAMGLWHAVEFYEKEKVVGEEYYQQWNSVLRENARTFYDWSYALAWVGVGWSLLGAVLFSGAAVCLRGEREREEAINMQYLMPVYPQKQQYAYAGYAVPPPQAYPAPYYTTGSTYGPYNY